MISVFNKATGDTLQFPEGTPLDTIRVAMKKHYGIVKTPSASTAAYVPDPNLKEGLQRYMEGYAPPSTQGLAKTLPTIGGAVGGLVGGGEGPGAVGGATIGGGLGKAGQELLTGQPLSITDIGKEAGVQGALQLGGGILAKGAAKFARSLMEKALSNTAALAERFNTTPEAIADLVLNRGRSVSTKGGQAERVAGRAAIAARKAQYAALDQITTGGFIGAEDLTSTAIKQAEESIGRPLTQQERTALIAKVETEANAILTGRTHGVVPKGVPGTPAQPPSTLLNQHGQPAITARPAIPPPPTRYTRMETNQIKMVAAKNARTAYRANQAALNVAADPVLSEQIASAARSTLPAKDLTTEIEKSMIARQAIRKALKKGTGAWLPVHMGPFALGAKVPREQLSNIALFLNQPGFKAFARQSPRLAEAMIVHMLSTDTPDTMPTPEAPTGP